MITSSRDRLLLRNLGIGLFTSFNLCLGFTLSFSHLNFNTAVFAQSAEQESIETRYARTLLGIEALRVTAYNEIKNLIGDQVPKINCNNRDSLSSISGEARSIAIYYCDQSVQIIQNNKLSIADFNKITTAIIGDKPVDSALRKRIQNELVRLQK